MHPTFLEITDTDGVRHIIRLERVSRVTLMGSEQTPESEVWLVFGGSLRLSSGETSRLLRHLDSWGHIIRLAEPDHP